MTKMIETLREKPNERAEESRSRSELRPLPALRSLNEKAPWAYEAIHTQDKSFEVIQNMDHIYQKALEMGINAEQDLLICGSLSDLERLDQSCFFEMLAEGRWKSGENKKGKELDIKVLSTLSAKSLILPDWVKERMRFSLKAGISLPHVFIKDHKDVLMIRGDGKICETSILALMSSLGSIWKNAGAL